MGIFRARKAKQTTTTPSKDCAPLSNQQTSYQDFYPSSIQPYWTNNWEQPPQPTGGYLSQQPQAFLISPLYQSHQSSESQGYSQLPPRPQTNDRNGERSYMSSVNDLLKNDVPLNLPRAQLWNDEFHALVDRDALNLGHTPSLPILILSRFNTVITQIDGESFSGDERELVVHEPPQPIWQQQQKATGYTDRALFRPSKPKSEGAVNKQQLTALVSTNYVAKVNLYANSRLPMNLRPLKLYVPTWPLLCLAAQYSERVYTRPSGKEKKTHVDADIFKGTKAMVIKSIPMDHMNTIIFAVRGTQTFMDWAVNLKSAPASPGGFLDDPGNLCHAGFLAAAKKMVAPVAARLRQLLEEDPGRASYSLLMTGHSAGGAIAALLYSHMVSTSPETESDLNILTGCFKRIHCVSFGAPPVTLLPLSRPIDPRLKKSLFLSFINEGDPVTRADKQYVKSLLNLYSTPAPGQSCLEIVTPNRLQPLISSLGGKSSSPLTINKIRPTPKKSHSVPPNHASCWPVPEATLSNAGRLVLLRGAEQQVDRTNKKKSISERIDEGVTAQIVTDELLEASSGAIRYVT